jgi:hypothetical protein
LKIKQKNGAFCAPFFVFASLSYLILLFCARFLPIPTILLPTVKVLMALVSAAE